MNLRDGLKQFMRIYPPSTTELERMKKEREREGLLTLARCTTCAMYGNFYSLCAWHTDKMKKLEAELQFEAKLCGPKE